jgi:hypothetical protein
VPEQREGSKGDVGLAHSNLVREVCDSMLFQNVVNRHGALQLRFGLGIGNPGGRPVSTTSKVQKLSRGID